MPNNCLILIFISDLAFLILYRTKPLMRGENPFKEEKMLLELLLITTVIFAWCFFAGMTEKLTGKKSIIGWIFILIYWIGLGRPKPVTKTEITSSADPSTEPLKESIKNLNNSICLLIQKMEERQRIAKKVKEEIKTNNTNQGE